MGARTKGPVAAAREIAIGPQAAPTGAALMGAVAVEGLRRRGGIERTRGADHAARRVVVIPLAAIVIVPTLVMVQALAVLRLGLWRGKAMWRTTPPPGPRSTASRTGHDAARAPPRRPRGPRARRPWQGWRRAFPSISRNLRRKTRRHPWRIPARNREKPPFRVCAKLHNALRSGHRAVSRP